nr:hypothetical protein [Tanacetum cinerariifolium]
MSTTDKELIAVGTDNRPPMLEENDFDSWKIQIQRYIRGKPNGKLIWNSIKNEPTSHPTTIDTTREGNKDKFTYLLTAVLTFTIVKLLIGFQKQFPPTNNQLRTSTNPMTQATIQVSQITTESVQRRAPANKEVEAFQADVECTAHYDDLLAITTTTAFEVIHEDTYDSDVDEAPHAAAAFMDNLTGTSTGEGTSNAIDFQSEVHTHNNYFFENVNHQVTQAMHQEEQLDSDVDSDIDDYNNIIPYHQYQSNTKVENVPTEVSHVLSDQISMITILDDMRLKLEGYMNTNKEQSLANDSLKAELERYKIQVEFNKSLKTKSEKFKSDNKAREDSFQKELVWLRHANKVVTKLLQSYAQPVQTIPMMSKRPTFASKDLHKTALGRSNPKYLKIAQLSRPTLYIGDVVVNPLHTPHRVHDSEDTLVHAEVSRTKMLEKMKDLQCLIISLSINYAKLNNLYDTFVPQKELTREHAYWLPANEVASNQSKPAQQFVFTRPAKSQVNSHLKTLNHAFQSLIRLSNLEQYPHV